MKRILLEIEYDGTNYHGWQEQGEQKTIQKTIQDKLSDFLNEEIVLYSSGRTDAGVHANCQYAHFDTNSDFDFSRLVYPINNVLPNDIALKNAIEVDSNFHSRFNAKEKVYRYYFYTDKTRNPLFDRYMLNISSKLNYKHIKFAMKCFVGQHNFSSFCAKREIPDKYDNVRKINYLRLIRKKTYSYFEISGNGFLYNMVRIIVGTLIDVGSGKINFKEIKNIIESKDRTKAGKTLSAKGLVLHKVIY